MAGDWHASCHAASVNPASAREARDWFEQWFAPLTVSAGNKKDGLFTGYYEPQLHVSRTRHGRYQTPVYGLPDDLVSVDLGAFRDTLKGERIAGRVEGHTLVPYVTRAEIDRQGLTSSRILFYGDDPVAVFFLHIQGSGRVLFDDRSVSRVAYAGQNGQPYTAIGKTLIAMGALKRENVSLQTISAWLHVHPEKARAVMESDASYIFFKETPLGDPALGSPGTAERAADTECQHRGRYKSPPAQCAVLHRDDDAGRKAVAWPVRRAGYRRRDQGRRPRRYLLRVRTSGGIACGRR